METATATLETPVIEGSGLPEVPVKASSIFDPGAVPTKVDSGVSVDAPRYCFIPLIRKPVAGTEFRVPDWHLPVNQIFVVRSFSNTITDVPSGGKKSVPRTAAAQANDIYLLAGREGGLDFPELAKLQDDDAARLICDTVLANPKICERYPDENGIGCVTCWNVYLNREAPAKIGELPFALQETARTALGRLQESLARAQTFARDTFRMSVDAIEGNKKARLSEQDRINMRNVHQEEPNFSGVMGQATGLGAEIAKGIAAAMATQATPQVDTGMIAGIIAEQLAPLQQKVADLEAENLALKADVPAKDVAEPKSKKPKDEVKDES